MRLLHLLFFKFKDHLCAFVRIMSVYNVCLVPMEARRGHRIPWRCTYRWLWAGCWEPPQVLCRAACALSPALPPLLLVPLTEFSLVTYKAVSVPFTVVPFGCLTFDWLTSFILPASQPSWKFQTESSQFYDTSSEKPSLCLIKSLPRDSYAP